MIKQLLISILIASQFQGVAIGSPKKSRKHLPIPKCVNIGPNWPICRSNVKTASIDSYSPSSRRGAPKGTIGGGSRKSGGAIG